MANRELPSPELLRQLLDYNPVEGELYWKHRDVGLFDPGKVLTAEQKAENWNKRYGGKSTRSSALSKRMNRYPMVRIFGTGYLSHRLIWAIVHGRWPHDQIDHINGRIWDNRLENLREASPRQNQRNRARGTNNTSGVIGVHRPCGQDRWQAKITVEGRTESLGYFDNLDEAVAARKVAERRYKFHPNHGRAPNG